MRPLKDSWALSSPNPVAVPPAPPFPGRQPLVPASSFPLQPVTPLSSSGGGFRGLDPNPVALPENFGSTSTSHRISCSCSCCCWSRTASGSSWFCWLALHATLAIFALLSGSHRVEGGTDSLVIGTWSFTCTTGVLLVSCLLLVTLFFPHPLSPAA